MSHKTNEDKDSYKPKGSRKGNWDRYNFNSENSQENQNSTFNHFRKRFERDLINKEMQFQNKKHPPHLKGKEIGLWYSRRQRSFTREPRTPDIENIKKVPAVHLNDKQINEIQTFLNSDDIKLISTEKDITYSNFLQIVNKKPEERKMRSECINTNQKLKLELLAKQENENYQKMQTFREHLPAFKMKDEILEKINKNQIILISGETGCGKTTQVAQFLLDHALITNNGSTCKIACTQPRRISAVSIAYRVAAERSERLGLSVGYQIRLEKEMPREQGSIVFCTTGILLQLIKGSPLLEEYSHVIIDEIHERDINCDLLLTVLKESIMKKRKDLKVILMSATLNSEIFSMYFDDCEIVHIPGLCYDVQELYLEDVLEKLKFYHFQPARGQKSTTIQKMFNEQIRDRMIKYMKNNKNNYSPQVLRALQDPSSELINLDLIEKLIWYICKTEAEGAILVFLPGIEKISKLHSSLLEKKSKSVKIFALHSMMPTVNQRQIFERPPNGMRKIIISTNISETSITIEDVKYVIDCGKCKLTTFDIDLKIESLNDEWISVANAKQRKGRAGRTSSGICYHLFSRVRLSLLEDYQKPEMLRTRIEQVILKIKFLQLGNISEFLQKVLDPPSEKIITLSIELLQRLNALDEEENLTPLGYHLAELPMDPQIGKMILMASLFSCLKPICSLGASLAFKDAFVYPLGKEREVASRKQELSHNTRSDHLMLAEAIKQFEEAQETNNETAYCWNMFLNASTLRLLCNMQRQFAEHLFGKKFLSERNINHPANNINSSNESLLKAIICAGLYPNVAFIKKNIQRNKKPAIIKLGTTVDVNKTIEFHPNSINSSAVTFDSKYFVYHKKMKTSNIYLYDTTMVQPLALIFFGDKIYKGIKDDIEFISVNELMFRCRSHTADVIISLKKHLEELLVQGVLNPRPINWQNKKEPKVKLLNIIMKLITRDDYSNFSYDDDTSSEEFC